MPPYLVRASVPQPLTITAASCGTCRCLFVYIVFLGCMCSDFCSPGVPYSLHKSRALLTSPSDVFQLHTSSAAYRTKMMHNVASCLLELPQGHRRVRPCTVVPDVAHRLSRDSILITQVRGIVALLTGSFYLVNRSCINSSENSVHDHVLLVEQACNIRQEPTYMSDAGPGSTLVKFSADSRNYRSIT